MNTHIIPDLTSTQAKKQFTDNIEAWRNFAQRITKNPFVKEFLLERDGIKCAWCNCVLQQNKIIHHTTYQHSCSYNVLIEILCPTDKYPNKTRVVPDCKSCKEDNNERFLNCINKLVLVHAMCNRIITDKVLYLGDKGNPFI